MHLRTMPCQPFCSSRNTTEGVAKNAASCWAFQQTEHPLAGGPKRTGLPQKFACERVCWYSVSVWLFLFDWDFGGYQGQDWTSSYSSYGVWKWGKKNQETIDHHFPHWYGHQSGVLHRCSSLHHFKSPIEPPWRASAHAQAEAPH